MPFTKACHGGVAISVAYLWSKRCLASGCFIRGEVALLVFFIAATPTRVIAPGTVDSACWLFFACVLMAVVAVGAMHVGFLTMGIHGDSLVDFITTCPWIVESCRLLMRGYCAFWWSQ
jgi:hypothetical protein